MHPDIISHPELNKPYLVRARLGGRVQARYAPAIVLEDRVDPDGIRRIQVQFKYSGERETIVFYDGLVKAITRRWLTFEHEQMLARYAETSTALEVLEGLLRSTGTP